MVNKPDHNPEGIGRLREAIKSSPFIATLIAGFGAAALQACDTTDKQQPVEFDDLFNSGITASADDSEQVADDDSAMAGPDPMSTLSMDQLRNMLISRHPMILTTRAECSVVKSSNPANIGLGVDCPENVNEREDVKEEVTYNFQALRLDDYWDEIKDDPYVREYFARATIEDLIADNVIIEKDFAYYFDLEGMWDRKISMTHENHKDDMRAARQNALNQPNVEGLDLNDLREIANNAEGRVRSKSSELGLESAFTTSTGQVIYISGVIDGELLVAISVHELINNVGTNPMFKMVAMRYLLEKGAQPNKFPALNDNVASFGVVQMTLAPYEGRTKNEGPYDDYKRRVGLPNQMGAFKRDIRGRKIPAEGDIEAYLAEYGLPDRLYDCVDLEDQYVAALLLQLVNLQKFVRELENIDGAVDGFADLWENANMVSKKKFYVSVVLASYHNRPASARRGVRKIGRNVGDYQSLDELTADYIETIGTPNTKVNRIAQHHALGTSALVDEIDVYRDEWFQPPVFGYDGQAFAF